MGLKRTLIVLCLAFPLAGQACYNDRDTLGFELRNRPDVQRALTGRFERNPPLYYAMRVARLRAKPRLTPAEVDDLAVALDRLGRDDEACAALARKRSATDDERYRFFANRGTVRAHRWLRHHGTKTELKAAEEDIVHALAINPKAHFGREAVQLELIRWLERPEPKPDAYDKPLGEWLGDRVEDVDPITGLAGLIELGGAWESPDVAVAIAMLAEERESFSIERLALERYQELRREGRPILANSTADWAEENEASREKDPPAGEPPIAASFRQLRNEAEGWHRARTDFMVARLKAGRHPDTDPTFWTDWREPAMPRLSPERRERASERGIRLLNLGFKSFVVLTLGLLIGSIVLIRRIGRRRRA